MGYLNDKMLERLKDEWGPCEEEDYEDGLSDPDALCYSCVVGYLLTTVHDLEKLLVERDREIERLKNKDEIS